MVVVQAVQLVQKARQSEDEAASHRASLQPGSTDAAVAALLASRPQRRLWDDIYTISYSRLALCSLLHVSLYQPCTELVSSCILPRHDMGKFAIHHLVGTSDLLGCKTLVLGRYENVEDKVESADSAMTGLAQLSLGAPPPHCRDPLKDTPLAELLFPALPNTLHASSQVQDALLVLKILECLNR